MKILSITLEIVKDIIRNVVYFIESNLRNIANLLNCLLPYIMLFIGQYVYEERGKFAIGGEILIPLYIGLIIYFIKSYANKIGKGTTIPTPQKRFTTIDDDGEVSIENNRIQELILYVSDLEDWLERKGIL